MTEKKIYTHRFIARLIIESETPLSIGSGESNVMTDQLVSTDVNGLPYIPGTALTGVLRNSVSIGNKDELFGYQKDNKGLGSRLIVSSAQMVGKEGKIIDGLQSVNFNDEFYQNFLYLPVRQHVRISHRGTSDLHGKFDGQVVYKGIRFGFEMELIGTEADNEVWAKLISEFSKSGFRLGGGTRKGFGSIKVQKLNHTKLYLKDDLEKYLDKSSDLSDEKIWTPDTEEVPIQTSSGNLISYQVTLTPEDFFLFSSGFGNDDSDNSFATEKIIVWKTGNAKFTEEKVLIPASSVKGALAHRVAFHYNYNNKITAEKVFEEAESENKPFDEVAKRYSGENNPAVRTLFGYSANDNDGQIGDVIFSDVHLDKNPNKKLLNHVAIDRFTGGAMDGALFSEEVVGSKETFKLTCLVNKDVKPEETKLFELALNAFEQTLGDLCRGMLPLGGSTMRGHGCFTGTITKNGKELKNEQ